MYWSSDCGFDWLKWQHLGACAAAKGEPNVSPYPPKSMEHEYWTDGWVGYHRTVDFAREWDLQNGK